MKIFVGSSSAENLFPCFLRRGSTEDIRELIYLNITLSDFRTWILCQVMPSTEPCVLRSLFAGDMESRGHTCSYHLEGGDLLQLAEEIHIPQSYYAALHTMWEYVVS